MRRVRRNKLVGGGARAASKSVEISEWNTDLSDRSENQKSQTRKAAAAANGEVI